MASGVADIDASSAPGSVGSSAASRAVVDETDFARIQREMEEEDAKREQLIKRSRDMLKLSKHSIYSSMRGDLVSAKADVVSALNIGRELLAGADTNPNLRFGAVSGAREEYAEAVIFLEFLEHGRIPTQAELEIVTREEYLGGIMDFTGELNRHAVLIATKRDICAVQKCRETLDLLNAQLMSFNWRNGNLRRKYDGVKYTLKKLEQIIYELTLASASVVPIIPKSGMDEPRPTGGSGGGDDEGMDGGDGGGDGGGDQFGDDLQGTSEGGAGRGGPAGSRGGRGGKRPRPAGQL